MTVCSALWRSAPRVASGIANTRTIMGRESTTPIAPASSPLAEPERQEWHLHTERDEQRGVEHREPEREGRLRLEDRRQHGNFDSVP